MSTNTSSLHVFQVLRLVAESATPLGVADIARLTGLPTTTTYRALVTLAEARYVTRDEGTAKYRIGQMPLLLLRGLSNRFAAKDIAVPALKALAADTGATVSLSMAIGWYGVRIASAAGSRDTQYRPRLGLCQLMHRSKAQSLMLATYGETELQAYRRFVRKHHAQFAAEVDRPGFGKELKALTDRGWVCPPAALGSGYHFAMPLRLPDGRAIGIFHVTGPVLEVPQPPLEGSVTRWLKLRDGVEKQLHQDPGRYQGPFQHIPRDEILLRITA